MLRERGEKGRDEVCRLSVVPAEPAVQQGSVAARDESGAAEVAEER